MLEMNSSCRTKGPASSAKTPGATVSAYLLLETIPRKSFMKCSAWDQGAASQEHLIAFVRRDSPLQSFAACRPFQGGSPGCAHQLANQALDHRRMENPADNKNCWTFILRVAVVCFSVQKFLVIAWAPSNTSQVLRKAVPNSLASFFVQKDPQA